MLLGCLTSLLGIKEKPAPTAEPPEDTSPGRVPEYLPVKVKRYFFSQDENAFFRSLEESLLNSPYRVFPNVRLEAPSSITDNTNRASVRDRLKVKHVDFLIVDASQDFKPVMATELDGRSHQREH